VGHGGPNDQSDQSHDQGVARRLGVDDVHTCLVVRVKPYFLVSELRSPKEQGDGGGVQLFEGYVKFVPGWGEKARHPSVPKDDRIALCGGSVRVRIDGLRMSPVVVEEEGGAVILRQESKPALNVCQRLVGEVNLVEGLFDPNGSANEASEESPAGPDCFTRKIKVAY